MPIPCCLVFVLGTTGNSSALVGRCAVNCSWTLFSVPGTTKTRVRDILEKIKRGQTGRNHRFNASRGVRYWPSPPPTRPSSSSCSFNSAPSSRRCSGKHRVPGAVARILLPRRRVPCLFKRGGVRFCGSGYLVTKPISRQISLEIIFESARYFPPRKPHPSL